MKDVFLICPILVKNLSWVGVEKWVLEVIQQGFIDTMSWISQANWILVNIEDGSEGISGQGDEIFEEIKSWKNLADL